LAGGVTRRSLVSLAMADHAVANSRPAGLPRVTRPRSFANRPTAVPRKPRLKVAPTSPPYRLGLVKPGWSLGQLGTPYSVFEW